MKTKQGKMKTKINKNTYIWWQFSLEAEWLNQHRFVAIPTWTSLNTRWQWRHSNRVKRCVKQKESSGLKNNMMFERGEVASPSLSTPTLSGCIFACYICETNCAQLVLNKIAERISGSPQKPRVHYKNGHSRLWKGRTFVRQWSNCVFEIAFFKDLPSLENIILGNHDILWSRQDGWVYDWHQPFGRTLFPTTHNLLIAST